MEIIDWKAVVLKKMGLTEPMTAHQICKQQNGIQAQVRSYADVGFLTRMTPEEYAGPWSSVLVRQWSIRGTVHAYLKEEIPLYLYEGRNYFKPSLHMPSRDGVISAQENVFYGDVILEALQSGHKSRDELKEICREEGLSKEKEASLFHPWGGITASLISEGRIYQEYGQQRFGLLTGYEPWDKEKAELEIARRYFSGFGPVSLADARYYFKEKKSLIETWMGKLDLKTVRVGETTRYYLGELEEGGIPPVLFVTGFDALLLGFEKKENPFFRPEHLRDIYTLTGIVKPVILLNGEAAATWRKDKKKIYVRPLRRLRKKETSLIGREGTTRFPGVSEVLFEESD